MRRRTGGWEPANGAKSLTSHPRRSGRAMQDSGPSRSTPYGPSLEKLLRAQWIRTFASESLRRNTSPDLTWRSRIWFRSPIGKSVGLLGYENFGLP